MLNFPPLLAPLVRFNEPMSQHTTFQVGGPADYFVRPPESIFPQAAAVLIGFAKRENIPLFVLGGGSNLVVSDKGIRGIVLDTSDWSGCTVERAGGGSLLVARSGTPSSAASDFALSQALSGIEFLAGLPGSIGGATWMNARRFEKSVSDSIRKVELLEESKCTWETCDASQFGYKKSPFQTRDALILHTAFQVESAAAAVIKDTMDKNKANREAAGHFRFPSAGSVFKNNRALGKPSGKIIEELGLKGTRIGGAQIAPWHGNFIINTGGARASDIRALVTLARETAREKRAIELESEVLFVGDWGEQ